MSNWPNILPPSPPESISRLSTGATKHKMSMSGGNTGRKYSTQVLEEQLQEHLVVLKEYLASDLQDERNYQPHHRARDKLLRLSSIQFQELSTDVYDELLRREEERQTGGASQSIPRFLLPKTNFHPKRNQARQKLSTLPAKKFRELATDVLFELERRYPRFGPGEIDRAASSLSMRDSSSNHPTPGSGISPVSARQIGNASQTPYSPGVFEVSPVTASTGGFSSLTPKTFQSNTIIPNKSTMVEEDASQAGDDDDDGFDGTDSSRRTTNKSLPYSVRDEKAPSEYQEAVNRLEEKVDELESKLRDKDDEVRQARNAEKKTQETFGSERERASNLKADLERQLLSAQNLNSSLQSELEKVRASHQSLQNDMMQHSNRSISNEDDSEWKSRYEALENDLHEQQQITDEVRREAINSLQEMRLLSQRSLQATESEDKLLKRVHQLEGEITQWKTRYARTKTQLRSLRASSIGLHIQQHGAAQYAKDSSFTAADGLVKDVHVTKFQIAIDELLHLSRNKEPESVLGYMRSIVNCVRSITQDIDQAQGSANDELTKQRLKLKAKVSAAANALITASKNFSSSNGLSPVSLIDAAASNLTTAVVDLIKTVKIRPTPAGELEDDDDGQLPPESSGHLPFRQRDLGNSPSSGSDMSPPQRTINGWSTAAHNRNPSMKLPNGRAAHARSKSSVARSGYLPPRRRDSELKDYLEEQTASLVLATQPFVQVIRDPTGSDSEFDTISGHINKITSIIGGVAHQLNRALEHYPPDTAAALKKHAMPIALVLEQCRGGLISAQMRAEQIGDKQRRREIIKDQMPQLAFKIVKCTKMLLGTVDDIERGLLLASDDATTLDA